MRASSPHSWTYAIAAGALALASTVAAHDEKDRGEGGNRPRKTQVVVISLDGAKPDLIQHYLRTGVLDARRGLGSLARRGVVADQNVTATPSVTAVSHIAIATGSTAAHNDIPANTYHAVAQPITATTSGFGGPIGGYQFRPLGPSQEPTAEPLWVTLREHGKKVVTATWPGGDGVDVTLFGTGNPPPVVQPAVPTRTVDYTVPFGTFGGIGAEGYAKAAGDFVADDGTFTKQLIAAGKVSYSPVRITSVGVSLSPPAVTSTFYCAPGEVPSSPCGPSSSTRTLPYTIRAAAIDTTNDGKTNYDTLVFFNDAAPAPQIAPGPFVLPSTGPAYARVGGPSARFYLEGSGNKVGMAYFVSAMAPDLSTVRFIRYGLNYIPRNPTVIADVDDINQQVGFWAPQPDFRIPERISPGFTTFPDPELESAYEDQVRTFVDYQVKVGLRGLARVPDADLAMIYIEQPDGSGHQFTLTDPRQATDFTNPLSIGRPNDPPGAVGQDPAKVKRYRKYLEFAYQQADSAVQRILEAIGVDKRGEPLRDVLVVSDHGMAAFHTAVSLANLLRAAGVDIGNNRVAIRTTGPAANIYINLQGREPAGTTTQVPVTEYQALVDQIASALRAAQDSNPYYNPTGAKLFSHVWTRPNGCGRPGFCTDDNIGQDTGDVLALMMEGYNFDGIQSPGVGRLGDPGFPAFDPSTTVYSVPNFYGAHGHDSHLPSMSAILYAAGPHITQHRRLRHVRNIDIAPTVFELLGVPTPATVDGRPLSRILRREDD